MKLRRPPSWLFGDVLCWIGVMVTFMVFSRAFTVAVNRMLGEWRLRFEPGEFDELARLQAAEEAWLRYAIARRAFRLAGLSPSKVRFFHPSLAATTVALSQRSTQAFHDHNNMDKLAERLAQRLRRLAALPARAAATTTTNNNTFAPAAKGPRPAATTTTTIVSARRPGLRVRAPPWRPATACCRLPNALLGRQRGRGRLRVTQARP